MKVAHAESHVISSEGLQEKQAFKIRTTSHAFRILSSGLYSDKVAAVLREISCNAHDGHIAAGKAHIPFDVKLPNKIDNQFYIKDYGTGLSHKDVMELYTTYFASTKQNSNDFTGAFGLGSKSPFSYTDSFTIESSFGGTRSTYSAHIGDDGAPNIALLGTAECGSDTGITISFPVNPQDFSQFADRAQSILQYFNPLPNMVASQKIIPVKLKEDFGDYAFIERDDGIKVQMGNVCYPVLVGDLNLQDQGTAMYNNLRNLEGVLLRFKMGDVQVAASREKLQYDTDSQRMITKALEKTLHQIALNLEKTYLEYKKIGTWAARAEFHRASKDSRRGFHIDKEFLEAAGVTKAEEIMKDMSESYQNLPSYTDKARYDMIYHDSRSFRYRKAGDCVYYNDSDEGPISIVAGTESYGRERIRLAMKAGDISGRVLLVVPKKDQKGDSTDVENMVQKLLITFKGVPEHRLDKFPGPAIAKTKSLKKGMVPPLPQWMLDMPEKVYVNEQSRGKRSRRETTWVFSRNADGTDNETIENSGIYQHNTSIATLATLMTFQEPAKLGRSLIKKYRMHLQPGWRLYKDYMNEELSKTSRIDILKKEIGEFKFRIELADHNYRSDGETGLLENMIHIKNHEKGLYDRLIPVLKKYKLFDLIEEVYKNSKSKQTVKPAEIVAAYKELAKVLHLQINVPEFDAPMVKLNEQFPVASRIPYRMYKDLAEHAPERLTDIFDQLLKKDDNALKSK